jgi:hypothetical protein
MDQLLSRPRPKVKSVHPSANSMLLPPVRLKPLTTPLIVVSAVPEEDATIEVEPEPYRSNTKELRLKSDFVMERFRIPLRRTCDSFRSKPSKQGNGSRPSRGGAFD